MQDNFVAVKAVTGFSPAAHPDPYIVLPPFPDHVVDVADGHLMGFRRILHRLVGHAPDGHAHSW